MKRIIFVMAISAILPLSGLKAEVIPLSLDEALAIALRDNFDLRLKAEDVKKAKEKIAESKAGIFPSFSFTGDWTDIRGLYAKNIAKVTSRATLKQYLYTGGKTTNQIEENKADLEVSEALLAKAKLDLFLNVKKSFYTVLLAEEFTKLNKEILDNSQAHLDYLQSRYNSGEASESEIFAVKNSLASVKEAHETSLNQSEANQALLKNFLYLDESVKLKAEGEFNYLPLEAAYDAAFLTAMRLRPEIRQYEAQGRADKKAVEVTKAGARPSIYASWDYYSQSLSSLSFSPSKGWQDYNVVGLTFSWPIFDGWQTKAKVQQALIDLKETQLTKEKTVKDIALELKNAYLALKDALGKIKAADSQITLYQDNFSVLKERYQNGIFSYLDVDDAQLKYKVALFNKNEAIYDYLIAKSEFDKAAGGA